ncbi:MAG: hypothetical protein K2Q22_05140, partial [Cytophagales bacterium]|nr:hypothetical protein [Cytophagales bacterium]
MPPKEFGLDTLVFTSSQPDTLEDSRMVNPEFFYTYFSKPKGFTFQFGYSTLWHWIAVPVVNRGDVPTQVYLVVQNAMIEYLDLKQVNQTDGSIVYADKTGFSCPFDYRDIKERHFVFKLELQPHTKYNVLLRAKNNAGNLIVPLRMFNTEGYISHQNFHHNVTTLTYAIWIMACFVALMLFFVLKESIYIYYFGYVFCLMMYWSSYEGISFELFWPNSSYLADISRNFYVPAAISFGAFILLIMTTSGRKLISLKKAIKWISWLFVPATVLVCIPSEYNPVRNVLVGVNDILLVSLILIILYAIVLKMWERNEYTQLLIVALSPMLIFTLIQVLTFRGMLAISRNNFIIQYGFGLCALVEIILMFVLLAYRFRNILDIYIITQKRLDQTSNMLEDYKEALKIRQLKPSYFNSKLS